MSKEPLDYEGRVEQQYRRLGTRIPVCVCCGETDPFCLELHHPAGQQHHEDVVIVCRNCHRKLTNQQQDHIPPESADLVEPLASDVRYLHGVVDVFARIAPTLRKLAARLGSKSGRQE